MKKGPLNWMLAVGAIGIIITAVAAYAGTPFNSVTGFGVICPPAPAPAERIQAVSGMSGYNSVRCSVARSPVGVYIGDSNVIPNAMFGYELCETGDCSDTAITLDAKMVGYCISSDPATPGFLNCIAGK